MQKSLLKNHKATPLKHSFDVRVYYSDTDCYGVVWHGNYLKWLEIGRSELLRTLGYDLKDLDEQNIIFPVVEQTCQYKSPAKFDDELSIVSELINNKSNFLITFNQDIYNLSDNKLILKSTVDLVTTRRDGSLYRKPPDIIKQIKALITEA